MIGGSCIELYDIQTQNKLETMEDLNLLLKEWIDPNFILFSSTLEETNPISIQVFSTQANGESLLVNGKEMSFLQWIHSVHTIHACIFPIFFENLHQSSIHVCFLIQF